MNYPLKAEGLKANDAKLGGKYRMNNVRAFIALLYLLYIASERKASVDYSDGKDSPNQLKLNPSLSEKISSILSIANLESLIVDNPLLSGQFEYILVAMERVFCLGSVAFNNRSYNNSKERTGGIRYPKTLKFSTNMMVLDLILSSINKESRNSFLKEWLQNRPFSDNEIEKKITSFLTICSQYSLFRVRTEDDDEIVYRPIGIYEQIAESGSVSIVDNREQAGTASIYNNVLKEGLNPWLNSRKTDNISFNEDNDITSYLAMLKTSLNIVRVSESDCLINTSPKETSESFPFDDNSNSILNYLSALRSKPFMILAGISGTGKSRIVREFAYMTCPKELQDEDGTTPGNYCMIEVKPNWHDSTELLGYYSAMNTQYMFTKFDRFVVKAWLHPEIPFFVCLDEMNLAPVEQYFAEFLSVLETRSRNKDGDIASGALIEAKYFNDNSKMVRELGLDVATSEWSIEVREQIVRNGLTLPPNLMIIGTVNMDDTTYQFSRKVIDRAMTIEMNGGELKNMFGNSQKLQYRVNPIGLSAFKAHYMNADEVLEAHADFADRIKEVLPQKIEDLNKMLEYTPFQVSYRVLNELVVYTGVLLDETMAKGEVIDFEQIVAKAFDQITLMKVLPRIEGDEDMFIREGKNVLELLQSIFAAESASHKKLTEMKERLDRTGFTRFWP